MHALPSLHRAEMQRQAQEFAASQAELGRGHQMDLAEFNRETQYGVAGMRRGSKAQMTPQERLEFMRQMTEEGIPAWQQGAAMGMNYGGPDDVPAVMWELFQPGTDAFGQATPPAIEQLPPEVQAQIYQRMGISPPGGGEGPPPPPPPPGGGVPQGQPGMAPPVAPPAMQVPPAPPATPANAGPPASHPLMDQSPNVPPPSPPPEPTGGSTRAPARPPGTATGTSMPTAMEQLIATKGDNVESFLSIAENLDDATLVDGNKPSNAALELGAAAGLDASEVAALIGYLVK